MTPDSDVIGRILDSAGARPVLVDVGASGKAHAPWQPVAHKSVFVGFDPDSRDLDPALGKAYAEHHIVPKIVAGPDAPSRIPFYLTTFPHCSSVLEPDPAALEPYIFASLFTVDRTIDLEATTLKAAMDGLGLETIDWLKIDTQGRDLTVLRGLDEPRRKRLLCIEVEPGFAQFYKTEETFTDIHTTMLASGFWLAHLKSQEFPRVRTSTIKANFGFDMRPTDPAARLFGASPTAAEARYFPTIAHLRGRGATMRDYATVWSFAVSTGLWGYALELCEPMAELEGGQELAKFMRNCVKATVAALANQV